MLQRDATILANLESLDNGKPFGDSVFDITCAVETFEYYAGWCDKYFGETVPAPGTMVSFTRKEPVGVVGQIIPWNYPILMLAWKWAPALAAGNFRNFIYDMYSVSCKASYVLRVIVLFCPFRLHNCPKAGRANPTYSSLLCGFDQGSWFPCGRYKRCSWLWTNSWSGYFKSHGDSEDCIHRIGSSW